MKTRSFDAIPTVDPSSLAVSLVAALVAVTCAAGERSPAPGRAASTKTAPGALVVPSAMSSAAPDAQAAPPDAGVALSPKPALTLPGFYRALGELARGERKASVRVLWLGDSHTSADFWTDAVRQRLQKRFGNGGPGFVNLGFEPYRHGGVTATVSGKWRHEPSSPAGSMKQLDRIFGLGGRRVAPLAADASAGVELLAGAVSGKARWSLAYRAGKKDDRFRVALSGEPVHHADAKSGRALDGSSIRHLDLDSKANAKLEIAVSGGAPELFGVVIESEAPGLVLDTLGISGARAATALSWDEAEWQAEARDRAPALFVLAYGTNEAASTSPVSRYETTLERLVGRVRGASPDADCLIIGPPDMAAVGGGSLPRVIEHDQAARAVAEKTGCGFFSPFEAMGGEGSFDRWMRQTPPLAVRDRVHLQPSGYEKVGQALVDALMDGYDSR